MLLSFAWERICEIDYIKHRAGNNTGRRENTWNLKPWALGQHSHPARLQLFTTSALSCSPPHGDTQGWDISGWKQPARQPLGMVPRHITSYRDTARTLHLNFLKGWIKSTRLWMGSSCQRVGGHPKKAILTEQPQLLQKTSNNYAEYRSRWNSLVKLDYKSYVQMVERKYIRVDR